MTRLPCGGGGDHGALGDEESAIGGSLCVVLEQGRVGHAVYCSASRHRSQHHPVHSNSNSISIIFSQKPQTSNREKNQIKHLWWRLNSPIL